MRKAFTRLAVAGALAAFAVPTLACEAMKQTTASTTQSEKTEKKAQVSKAHKAEKKAQEKVATAEKK